MRNHKTNKLKVIVENLIEMKVPFSRALTMLPTVLIMSLACQTMVKCMTNRIMIRVLLDYSYGIHNYQTNKKTRLIEQLEACSLQSTKAYGNERGTRTYSVLGTSTYYLDSDGNWQNVDNGEVYYYENRKGRQYHVDDDGL